MPRRWKRCVDGAPGGTRTHDPRIRNPVLYPAELRARRGLIAAIGACVIMARGRLGLAALVGPDTVLAATVRMSKDGGLALDNGTALRLAGIVMPDPALARPVMGAWLARGPVDVTHGARALDRHGWLRAVLCRQDRDCLQGALVGAGAAVVDPAWDVAEARLKEWLALEADARARRLGVWARGPQGPWPASHVDAPEGSFVVIEGVIVAVARAREFVYANFGEDHARDATLRVPIKSVARLTRAGLDLRTLAGRRVRARGYLVWNNGPMLEITHPQAIEVVP